MSDHSNIDEQAQRLKDAGWTREFVYRFNHATKEEISQAMEKLPTDALEWAVKFEALSSRANPEGATHD